MIHLKSSKARGDVTLRRYQHARHGIVETLTRGSVVMVRPVFGLLEMLDNDPKHEPSRAKPYKGRLDRASTHATYGRDAEQKNLE